jgi:hypothetical protein
LADVEGLERLIDFIRARSLALIEPVDLIVVTFDGLADLAHWLGSPCAEEAFAYMVARTGHNLRAGDALFQLGVDALALVLPGDGRTVGVVVDRLVDALTTPQQLGPVEV